MTTVSHRLVVLAPLSLEEDTAWPAAWASAVAVSEASPELLVLGDGPIEQTTCPAARIWRAGTPQGLSSDQLAVHAAEALTQIQAQTPDQPLLVVAPRGPGASLAAAIAAIADYQPLGLCESARLEAGGLSVVKMRGRIRLDLSCRGAATLVLQPVSLTDPHQAADQSAPDETILTLSTAPSPGPVIVRRPLAGRGVNLEAAALVVSGGRGLGEDGFALLDSIAEQLGAGLGASLAAVDLGLAPVSRQIGQSGKFVAPRIYLAVGLSGTPQHMAGVARTTRILAINNDPDAAIFESAELGMVADWRLALPALLEAIGERR